MCDKNSYEGDKYYILQQLLLSFIILPVNRYNYRLLPILRHFSLIPHTIYEGYYLLGYNAMQSGLHSITSQKTVLFITTAVKTSNPIQFMSLWVSQCNASLHA
jgi:hypothetical protein